MSPAEVIAQESCTPTGSRYKAGTRTWSFVALTFGISWIIWIAAIKLGAGVGSGEFVLAFGSAGPAISAIILSRSANHAHARTECTFPWFRFVSIWLVAWAVYAAHDRIRGAQSAHLMAYIPLIGVLAIIPAWVLCGAFVRDSGVRALLKSFVQPSSVRWQAIAFFFFPAFLLIPALVARLLGAVLIWPQHSGTLRMFLLMAITSWVSNFLFTAVLEEPGWRGFLLPALQERFSPLIATVLVWLPWAAWHLPLGLSGSVARDPMFYVQVRIVFGFVMAVILTWLYNRSGANLLAVAILHASMNTFPFVLPYAPRALPVLIVFAIFAIIFDRMWRRQVIAGSSSPAAVANRSPL